METNYQPILDAFKNARIVFIEFKDKKYPCRLVDYELGIKMVFTVPKVDGFLCTHVTEGEPVVLRLITPDGNILAYESELLLKKLPRITLKFPGKEDSRFVRSDTRIPSEIRVKVIANRNEAPSLLMDISSIGAVTDLSDKGCSLTVGMKLEINDIVTIVVTLHSKGSKKTFPLRGTVQRTKTTEEGKNNYGIEFSEKDQLILKEIKKFDHSGNTE